MNKINYMISPSSDEKVLPFQYYDEYNLVTIPVMINEKRPFIKNWTKTKKTIHPTFINQNIGILTGQSPNNLTVLDIDETDEGMKYWRYISKSHNDIITPTAKSPSGGIHLYFKYNKHIPTMHRIKIDGKKIGWDIKSNNSIMTCPPSMIDHKKYKWIDDKSLDDVKIINMPKWLESFILSHLK